MRQKLLVAFLAVGFSVQVSAQAPVQIHILYRGAADGILIQTPNEKWVVIDAGRGGSHARELEEDWGVEEIELAVVSHRHYDHQGGMDEVIRLIPTKRFLGNMNDCLNRTGDDNVRAAVNDEGVQVVPWTQDTLEIDGVTFTVLPDDDEDNMCPDDENNNSIVVRLDYGAFSMLFTGDAETEQRTWLMEHHPDLLDVDVLKASHHGAINGADGFHGTRSWIEYVDPLAVVISANGRSHGHPNARAVRIYERSTRGRGWVHCTNRHGQISVIGWQDGWVQIDRERQDDRFCSESGSP